MVPTVSTLLRMASFGIGARDSAMKLTKGWKYISDLLRSGKRIEVLVCKLLDWPL